MAMEERRLLDLARMVPATLLLVGTSEKVITSIKGARELLAGDKWGFDDSDDPASPPSNPARGGDRGASDPVETAAGGGEDGVGVGVHLETTGGGDRSVGGTPSTNPCGSPARLRCGVAANNDGGEDPVGIRVGTPRGFVNWGDLLASALETTGGGDHSVGGLPLGTTCGSPASLRRGVPVNNDGGSEGAVGVRDGTPPAGFDKWADAADLLAGALAPEGHLLVAYREITRLVALHAEAGHVFVACAARLGLQQGDGGDGDASPSGQSDDDAPWKRWMDLREAAVRHAHDALLRLSSTASAAAAAEDFLRWRSAESPRREGWQSAARKLVEDARRSLGEAKDSVRLMRDAVLCEFFETWMILKRA
ncbi:unnamed protein product [Urochloa decumbens]|uniref:Uncharacterized protein n=1 Tax=Urochloa decumbens TaxID=240449 RepID=A0ABC9AF28_9POAL